MEWIVHVTMETATDPEVKIKKAFFRAWLLCFLSLALPIASLLEVLRPQAEAPGLWFGRSGAVMTVFAAIAQFRSADIETMLQGSTFAESWTAYYRHIGHQQLLSRTSLALLVLGTLVWGYGDFIYSGIAAAFR